MVHMFERKSTYDSTRPTNYTRSKPNVRTHASFSVSLEQSFDLLDLIMACPILVQLNQIDHKAHIKYYVQYNVSLI